MRLGLDCSSRSMQTHTPGRKNGTLDLMGAAALEGIGVRRPPAAMWASSTRANAQPHVQGSGRAYLIQASLLNTITGQPDSLRMDPDKEAHETSEARYSRTHEIRCLGGPGIFLFDFAQQDLCFFLPPPTSYSCLPSDWARPWSAAGMGPAHTSAENTQLSLA